MRLRALLIAAGVAALLAGCGGSSSSPTTSSTTTAEGTTPSPYAPLPNGEASKFPDTIVNDAIAAASGATGVHIVGSVSNAGKPLKLNLNLERSPPTASRSTSSASARRRTSRAAPRSGTTSEARRSGHW
jgi:ABC-type glycerol-3-phosphate transport system substrate-binding protein